MKFKQKKNVRQRGDNSHGWGAKKKHRGAGNRGGRGMAGTGKRGDAKKPSILKDKKYFGRYGFVRPNKEQVKSVNISYFEDKLMNLVASGTIKEDKGSFVIDMKAIGLDKLLGCGSPKRKFKIMNCRYATESAIEKIEKAGGSVELMYAEAGKKKGGLKPKDIKTGQISQDKGEESPDDD